MKLIAGLGNPGKKYEATRHNAGFWVVDRMAHEQGVSWSDDSRHHAHIAKITLSDESVILVKPQTYMNLSGQAVQAIASYYKIPVEDILIIHDEMDLAPGRIAFIESGRPAGHNGVADIHEKFGTQKITRLRLGVGRPEAPIAKEDYVLGAPSKEDLALIENAVERATKAVHDWATKGVTLAMNTWNANS